MKNIFDTRGAAIFFLTLTTAIWGWSFVVVKESIQHYPVFSFLSLRFLLGALSLLPFVILRRSKFDKKMIFSGIFLGFLLYSGYSFQTVGLLYTTPAHSGFITGLFVVFTPLLETIILRRKPSLIITVSLILSTVGLFLISYQPDTKGINLGDFLSLICAIIYSFHLVFLDRYSKKFDVLNLAFLQVASVSVYSFITLFILKSNVYPISSSAIKGIILTGLFATALCYLLQTKYQRITTATQAAIIFTMEPLFAGIFSYLLWNEIFSFYSITGGMLILTGMIISQTTSSFENKRYFKRVD